MDLTLTRQLASPNRTKATEDKYRQRFIMLVKQCRKSLMIPSYENISSKEFVGWLVANRNLYAYATWRQYKSSALFVLQELNEPYIQEVIDFLKNSAQTIDAKERQLVKRSSAKKQERVSVSDFSSLVSAIDSKVIKSDYLLALKSWMSAGILTGLRPTEWATSQFVDGSDPVLIVNNAKNTNGRAHGDQRIIHLKNLSQKERDHIKYQVANANNWHGKGEYKRYYDNCASLLTRLGKFLWPRRKERPSLYSFRHQFCADAKATGLTLEEIAALMGHAVDDTATVHYAKRMVGKNLCRVKPDPKDVLRIRKVFESKSQKKMVYLANKHINQPKKTR